MRSCSLCVGVGVDQRCGLGFTRGLWFYFWPGVYIHVFEMDLVKLTCIIKYQLIFRCGFIFFFPFLQALFKAALRYKPLENMILLVQKEKQKLKNKYLKRLLSLKKNQF